MEKMKYYRGIKLCPKCQGEGVIYNDADDVRFWGKPEQEQCPMCRGSGRIRYYTEVKIQQEPFTPP